MVEGRLRCRRLAASSACLREECRSYSSAISSGIGSSNRTATMCVLPPSHQERRTVPERALTPSSSRPGNRTQTGSRERRARSTLADMPLGLRHTVVPRAIDPPIGWSSIGSWTNLRAWDRRSSRWSVTSSTSPILNRPWGRHRAVSLLDEQWSLTDAADAYWMHRGSLASACVASSTHCPTSSSPAPSVALKIAMEANALV